MARKRTGTVIREKNARGEIVNVPFCTLPDGSRRRLKVVPGESYEKAKDRAAHWSQRFAGENVTRPTSKAAVRARQAECAATVAWWETFFGEHEARGDSDWKGDRGRFRKHIRPVIDKLMADVTRDDCEQLRDALDAKIRSGALAWKTAWNVWSVWTTACTAASSSKVRAQRVRADNPCTGVQPPERREKKSKAWLWPSEMVTAAEL